jgi:hypothetical protein
VEGKLAKLDRLQVVHDGEDTLLHLTSVLGTEDDHLHSLEVDLDRGGGSHTGGESVGRELTGVVDDKVGFTKVGELLGSGSDQHVVHKQGVVGSGSDNSDLDSVFWVPTRKTVKDVNVFSRVQVVDSTFSVDLEGVFARCQYCRLTLLLWIDSLHLDVDGTPPDVVLASIFVDDTLVFWRTTSLLSGEVDQSTV